MKTTLMLLPAMAMVTLFFSCDQTRTEKTITADRHADANPSTQQASPPSGFMSTDNSGGMKDTSRKFVRTASLKFKVADVVNATSKIEDITNHYGGFVTYTNLTNTVEAKSTTAVSADSSLETTYSTYANSILLRVPNTRLDSTLHALSPLIDGLDYRIIKAEDVRLQLLANELTQARNKRTKTNIINHIYFLGGSSGCMANNTDGNSGNEEAKDKALIDNLSLTDQVAYSTVELSIYQRQGIRRELVANYKNIDAYTPSFSARFVQSLQAGWVIIEAILIFVAQFWGIWLVGIIACGVYFFYRRRLRSLAV